MITNKLEKLRLEAEFFLISGDLESALQCYDKIIEMVQDPYILTARAKVLENLDRQPEALENFESALRLTAQDEIRTLEILRLILGVDQDVSGLLKILAKENIQKYQADLFPHFLLSSLPKSPNLDSAPASDEVPSPPVANPELPSSLHELDELKKRLLTDPDTTKTVTDHAQTMVDASIPEVAELPKPQVDENAQTILEMPVTTDVDPSANTIANFTNTEDPRTEAMIAQGESTPDSLPSEDESGIKTVIARNPSRPLPPVEDTKNTIIEDTKNTIIEKEHIPETKPQPMDDIPPQAMLHETSYDQAFVNKKFGRYQLLKKLGEGGMGIVYKAHDPSMDRIVALKLLRVQKEIAQQQTQRFLQEVKATARLQHPGIVSIFEFDEYPQPYFTMEYVPGKTLAACIREGIYKPKRAAIILKTIAEAIGCAHRAGIIHRDLKPGNIMMTQDQNPKVMDFGLAKLEGEAGLSKTGDIMGTPAYMPPEQAQGRKVDQRTDIYSLGAIGYEMVTGRPVFQGDSVFNILHQVANQEPTRPIHINANVDVELETILLKCLEKSPSKRYATAQDLVDDLTRYLENRPILAKPPTQWMRIVKWTKRNKEIAIAGASLVVLIIGCMIWLYTALRTATNLNTLFSIINTVSRWDLSKISYDKHAKPLFQEAEKGTPCTYLYGQWGEFLFRYAQIKPVEEQKQYYQEAAQKFEIVLSQNSEDIASLYYLYIIHTTWNDYEKAAAYTERLLKAARNINSQHNEFYHIIRAIDIGQNPELQPLDKLQQQIQEYEESLNYNSRLFCVYNSLGLLYLQKAKLVQTSEERVELHIKANLAFDNSLRLNVSYAVAHLNRADLYLDMAQNKLPSFKANMAKRTSKSPKKDEIIDTYVAQALQALQEASKLCVQGTEDWKRYNALSKQAQKMQQELLEIRRSASK